MTEKKWDWFPQARTKNAIDNNMRTFRKMEGNFAELKPFLAAAGFEIVNSTRGGKLRAFPTVDLAEEVARVAVDTDGTTAGVYDASK